MVPTSARTTWPGTRAPHLWLATERQHISTLDLFGRNWVLVTEDDRWSDPARLATKQTEITLDYRRIGADALVNRSDAFQHAFGLAAGGAALVRPDGYLAWRARTLPADPANTLIEALRHVSSAAGAA